MLKSVDLVVYVSKCEQAKIKLNVISCTERQAAEACEWLKAAGFPQYVQLYESKKR